MQNQWNPYLCNNISIHFCFWYYTWSEKMHRTSIPLHSYYYWFSIWHWLALKYQGLAPDENASDKFVDTQRLHVRFRRNANGNESSCSNHENCTERVRHILVITLYLYSLETMQEGDWGFNRVERLISIFTPSAKYLTTWSLLVLSSFAVKHQCWNQSRQISAVQSPHRQESNNNRLSYWFDYLTITSTQTEILVTTDTLRSVSEQWARYNMLLLIPSICYDRHPLPSMLKEEKWHTIMTLILFSCISCRFFWIIFVMMSLCELIRKIFLHLQCWNCRGFYFARHVKSD